MNSNKVFLQQDGAQSHTGKHQQLPAEREVTFIEHVMRPTNSPDLNLSNYAVWRALEQRMYCDDGLIL